MRAALTAWLGLSLSTPAGAQAASSASFRFSAEAGAALKVLWEESVEAHQERVACLAADIRGVSATASIEQCGPPEWDGTVHTHVALYTDDSPSQRFSGQDRTAMQMWYDRWHTDGVFCVAYSEHSAHCEADGVVGGMRSRPRYVH